MTLLPPGPVCFSSLHQRPPPLRRPRTSRPAFRHAHHRACNPQPGLPRADGDPSTPSCAGRAVAARLSASSWPARRATGACVASNAHGTRLRGQSGWPRSRHSRLPDRDPRGALRVVPTARASSRTRGSTLLQVFRSRGRALLGSTPQPSRAERSLSHPREHEEGTCARRRWSAARRRPPTRAARARPLAALRVASTRSSTTHRATGGATRDAAQPGW